MDHQLINFKIPLGLKNRLDQLAKLKGMSRTSILIQLIETYCRTELRLMQQDERLEAQFRELDQEDDVGSTGYYDPPMIPSVEGDWDDGWRL
jgi:predicted transcriptional regulator